MALTDFLSGIADAIRTKDGTSELIPATDFPQRILDIPSSGNAKCSYGSITIPTDGMTEITIEHDLGVIPNFIEVHGTDKFSNSSLSRLQTCLINTLSNGVMNNYYVGTSYNNYFRGGNYVNIFKNINEKTFDIIPPTTLPLYATTYYWTAIYIEKTDTIELGE